MRHRIRDALNTILEVGAELAHDLLWNHVRRRSGMTALEQRVAELEHTVATRGAAVRVDTQGRPLRKAAS